MDFVKGDDSMAVWFASWNGEPGQVMMRIGDGPLQPMRPTTIPAASTAIARIEWTRDRLKP